MKFEAKGSNGQLYVGNKSYGQLFYLTNGYGIHIYRENSKSSSSCSQGDSYFDCHGYKNPMIGKPDNSNYTPKRITVIQMK